MRRNAFFRKPLDRLAPFVASICWALALALTSTGGARSASAQSSEGCVATSQTLCFGEGRFEVSVVHTDFGGRTSQGNVVPGATDDSGTFWFFDADNWEMVVKVLDGCAINDRYWVFLAPMTTVEFRLSIVDTRTGRTRSWFNPLGSQGQTVADTSAFPCTEVETKMPALPAGLHHGFQVAFEALPSPTAALADELEDQSIERGLVVSRAVADWAELEPEPGVYDMGVLDDALEAATAKGLLPFVLLPAVDSEGLVVPPDLLDPENPNVLRDGLTLSSPVVVDRYLRVLDWAVPKIEAAGGWVVSVSNEPDGYLDDFAPQGARPLVDFVAAARQRVRSLSATLPTTITLTGGSLLEARDFAGDLVAVSDVVSLNYYCLNGDLTFRGPLAETVPKDIARIVEAANGRELIFQELGCPSGRSGGSFIGVNQADSNEFFQRAYALLSREPTVRATFAFQLVDWSAELVEFVYGPLRTIPGGQVIYDRLAEWLETTGFVTFDTQEVKPSWAEYAAALPGRRRVQE